jgi:hypothetical protein
MRVIEQTHRKLTLKHTPWGRWITGGVILLCGGLLGGLVGGSTRLECDRPSNLCTITRQNLLGERQHIFALDNLLGAEVDHNRSRNGGSSTFRVVLQTQEGDLPLTTLSTPGRGIRQGIVEQIEGFLANPEQLSLAVQEDNRQLKYMIFWASGVIGLSLLLTPKIMNLEINKTLGQLILSHWGILERKQQNYPLRRLVGARVERKKSRSGRSTTYRVALVQDSGETIPLTHSYSSGRSGKQETVDQICKFLELPDLSDNPDDGMLMPAKQIGNVMRLAFSGKDKRQQRITELRQQLQQDPGDANAYCELAWVLMMEKRQEEARALLEHGRSQFMAQGDTTRAEQLNQMLEYFER